MLTYSDNMTWNNAGLWLIYLNGLLINLNAISLTLGVLLLYLCGITSRETGIKHKAMNAQIEGVTVSRSVHGKLDVIAPAGMTGRQLSAWKSRNESAIHDATQPAEDADGVTGDSNGTA